MKKLSYLMLIAIAIFLSPQLFAQNVGIGVEEPLQKLHVNGAIKIGSSEDNVEGSLRWSEEGYFEGNDGDNWFRLADDSFVNQEIQTESAWVNDGNKVYLQETTDSVAIGSVTPTANFDLNGTQVIRSATLTLSNGTYDDLVLPAKSFIMLTGYTEDIDIRGFAGGTDGLIIHIHNYSDKKIKLKHLDNHSAPENQLILRDNNDRDIDKNMIGSFIYNGQINKWVLMSEH